MRGFAVILVLRWLVSSLHVALSLATAVMVVMALGLLSEYNAATISAWALVGLLAVGTIATGLVVDLLGAIEARRHLGVTASVGICEPASHAVVIARTDQGMAA